MAQLINGKEIAEKLTNDVAQRVAALSKNGIIPKIALVNASPDPASKIYIGRKKKIAETIGIVSDIYKFDADVSEHEICSLIEKLNADKSVHAILLQSPLSGNLDFRKLIDMVDPSKDVDGLTTVNQGRLFVGESGIVPCTPMGIMRLIKSVRDKLGGMHAVVLGRSTIVGNPVAQLLMRENCTITIVHSRSQNIPEICRSADILVSAIGKPNYVTKDFVKPGAIVIDVGINRIINSDGSKKIVGDVSFDEVFEITCAVTPVPNGVGPMTVACLMHNTVSISEKTT